jgi:hypothetical protein
VSVTGKGRPRAWVAVSPASDSESACVGAGRSVPARHLAAGPPEIKKKEKCPPVCADPVDLQGQLGCGALSLLALGRKQEGHGPSDSPSRAPRHLVEPWTRSS